MDATMCERYAWALNPSGLPSSCSSLPLLSRVWGAVGHLKGVQDSEALRAAVEEVQPENVKLRLRLSQSRPLYDAFLALKEGPEWTTLNDTQKRIVDNGAKTFGRMLGN
eukprot:353600-Chlamydomonas_euryale.AAC.17